MKILLVCSAGMSTSLLVERMKKTAVEKGITTSIFADSIDNLEKWINEYDVILLGPQIRYKEKYVAELSEQYGKKYSVIPATVYGMVDGVKAFQLAIDTVSK